MTSFLRFVVIFFVLGLVYPAAFTMLANTADPYLDPLRSYGLLLWPTGAIGAEPAAGARSPFVAFVLSAASNAVLYAAIGAAVWWVIKKQLWILVPVAGVISAGWYYYMLSL